MPLIDLTDAEADALYWAVQAQVTQSCLVELDGRRKFIYDPNPLLIGLLPKLQPLPAEAPTCARCGRPIHGCAGLAADDGDYHEPCFQERCADLVASPDRPSPALGEGSGVRAAVEVIQ